MAEAFVIRNQLGQYLTRKNEWVSGKDPSVLYCQPHFDQALNQLIEINAKDIELRGEVASLEMGEKGKPIVTDYGPDPIQPELEALDAEDENKPAMEKESDENTVAAY